MIAALAVRSASLTVPQVEARVAAVAPDGTVSSAARRGSMTGTLTTGAATQHGARALVCAECGCQQTLAPLTCRYCGSAALDWIELAGPPDATNRWNVQTVQNLTTGSTVLVMGGRPNKVATVIALVVLSVGLLVFVVVMIAVLASFGSS